MPEAWAARVAAGGPGAHRGVVGVRRSECRWCVMIGSDSGFYSAFLDDAAARELWTDIDDITAGWLFPGGQAVSVDGGYRVSGRWKFASGCTHADVMVAGCIVMNDNGAPVLGPDGMPWCAPLSPGPIASRSSTPGARPASPAAEATTHGARPVRAGRAHVLVGRPVKRDGPLHAIPGGFLANMQAVPLGLARRAIDEAIAVRHRQGRPPRGVGDRARCLGSAHGHRRREREHRSAQAYVSRSIDDAWTRLSSELAQCRPSDVELDPVSTRDAERMNARTWCRAVRQRGQR